MQYYVVSSVQVPVLQWRNATIRTTLMLIDLAIVAILTEYSLHVLVRMFSVANFSVPLGRTRSGKGSLAGITIESNVTRTLIEIIAHLQ